MPTFTNPKTGETRDVPADQLAAQDAELRNQGFTMGDAAAVDTAEPTEPTDYDDFTVDELKAQVEERGIEVHRADGEAGSPLKSDYIKALKRQDRKDAQA